MRVAPFLLLVTLLYCACTPKNADIPEVIDRVESVGVKAITNTAMHLQGGGSTSQSGLLYLSNSVADCGPYIVDYDYKGGTVNSIEDKLVLSSCASGPFEPIEIAAFTQVFAELDVRGIKVDLDTNVFIRTNDLHVEDLIRTKNRSLTSGMAPVPGYPNWYVLQ